MKRNRVIFLDNNVITGEEISEDEFFDLETFRQCATQWDGRDSVMILRNVTVSGANEHESLEYMLINRAEIRAVGIGGVRFEPSELVASAAVRSAT